MATLKTIQMEIIRLRAAYPYPDRSVEEMKVLAEIWMEDFEFMDDETFRRTCNHTDNLKESLKKGGWLLWHKPTKPEIGTLTPLDPRHAIDNTL